jgi:hypothetical protein
VKGEQGYDLKHPTNAGYLARALVESAQKGKATKPGKIPKIDKSRAAVEVGAREKPKPAKAEGKPRAHKPESNPKADEKSKAETLRAALVDAGLEDAGMDVDEMIGIVMQRGYWDTMKVKEDVLKRQLDRAREVGSVIDQRIIESLVGGFIQEIIANFVDSPQKQAMQICQMLGAEGKERGVTEYLEKDNERRLRACDEKAKRIAADMKRAGRRRKAAAA